MAPGIPSRGVVVVVSGGLGLGVDCTVLDSDGWRVASPGSGPGGPPSGCVGVRYASVGVRVGAAEGAPDDSGAVVGLYEVGDRDGRSLGAALAICCTPSEVDMAVHISVVLWKVVVRGPTVCAMATCVAVTQRSARKAAAALRRGRLDILVIMLGSCWFHVQIL